MVSPLSAARSYRILGRPFHSLRLDIAIPLSYLSQQRYYIVAASQLDPVFRIRTRLPDSLQEEKKNQTRARAQLPI